MVVSQWKIWWSRVDLAGTLIFMALNVGKPIKLLFSNLKRIILSIVDLRVEIAVVSN